MTIIVSFTTIPQRLQKDLPKICIESLLSQSIKPDLIIVNVPECSKTGQSYSFINAKKLELCSELVKVQFGVKDIGPITKLVPTLDFIKSNDIVNPLIILVDDDCIYDPLMIENLITLKKNKPEQLVIGTAGRIKQKNKLEHIGITGYNAGNILGVNDHIYVDIIETFAGVLYDYKLFKDTDFMEWISDFPAYVMLADDIVLSTFAKKQGAKLYKIIQNRPIVNHDPKKTIELNTQNDFGGNNDRVYEFFENWSEKERISKLINKSSNNSFAKFANLN